ADIADVLSGGDLVADVDVKAALPQVGVGGGDLLPTDGVFDDDQPAVPTRHRGVRHNAVGGGEDGGAVGGGVVRAGVELVLPGDGVDPHPKRRGGDPGALRQREDHTPGLGQLGALGCGGGEGGQDLFGDGLVVRIPVGVGRHLDG